MTPALTFILITILLSVAASSFAIGNRRGVDVGWLKGRDYEIERHARAGRAANGQFRSRRSR